MSLDPHVKALLDMLVAAASRENWQLTPPEARLGLLALAKAADIKDVPIGRVEDGTLPGPAGPLPWRSYTPAGAAAATLPGSSTSTAAALSSAASKPMTACAACSPTPAPAAWCP